LPVLWLAAILPFLVVDNYALRPGLPYAFPGVGLDRLDDGEFLRPPLSLRHTVILLPAAAAICQRAVMESLCKYGILLILSAEGVCFTAEKVGLRLMEERDFFEEKAEQRKHTLTCPHCGKSEEYEVGWLVRRKKAQLHGRPDERDRARFAKAQSYMVRKDDTVGCKNIRCRKRFEVSSLQSVAFL
jgi:adenine-specific DNA methylase